jgi:two-component sensor histidine kinase
VDVTRIATTELISNAVRHGGLSEGDEIRLSVEVSVDVVRVDVEQPTSAEAACVSEAGADPDGRFGLVIVDVLTERWGVTRGEPGHVWFEVSRFPVTRNGLRLVT